MESYISNPNEDFEAKACEISYSALRQGQWNVKKLKKDNEPPKRGFDLEVANGEDEKTTIGIHASDSSKFYISREELKSMVKSTKESSYVIHSYKFKGDKVSKFSVYGYDPKTRRMVDITDPKSFCAVREVLAVGYDGLIDVVIECTPKRKIFAFTKKD